MRGGWVKDAGGEAGNGFDGREVEIFPGAKVANIPPAVGVDAVADEGTGDRADRGVKRGEVFSDGGCRSIRTLKFRRELAVGLRRVSHFWRDEVGDLWHNGRRVLGCSRSVDGKGAVCGIDTTTESGGTNPWG